MALRSAEITNAYKLDQEARTNFRDERHLADENEQVVREFTHWVIIENIYPYDLITKEHHLLIPRRVFSTMQECERHEWEEYKEIVNTLHEEGYYSGILENFPKGRSIMKHLHLHLLVYKD